MSFWVLSQFELSIVSIWVFEMCLNWSYGVFSQIELMSFITNWVFNYLSFWVLVKYEFSNYVSIWVFELGFWSVATIWVFKLCHNLSFWVLSQLEFWIFFTIQFFLLICCNCFFFFSSFISFCNHLPATFSNFVTDH